MNDERSRRDEATRALAQREFRTPLVVEAGAGTGKTALLVARVAAWCVGEGWELEGDESREKAAGRVIDGVVAITFTEAAAAEMAARIGEALAGLAMGDQPVGWIPGDVIAGLEDEEIAVRSQALCGEVHRLQVTTIHAFCQRVLTAHPFEAGLHPRFEIDAAGDVLEALVDEVVLEALRNLEDSPIRDAWELLAGRGHGPVEVAEALRSLVESGARPADLERDPFDRTEVDSVVRGLAEDLRALLKIDGGRLAKAHRVQIAHRTMAALVGVEKQLGDLIADSSFEDLVDVLASIDKETRKKLQSWSEGDFKNGESACLEDDVDDLAAASGSLLVWFERFKGADPKAFGAGRVVLLDLLCEVEAKRAERGIATFTDLLVRTARLLEEHDGICRSERLGMDQLLVDEFQDTDDIQCRIVRRLALDGPEDQRPGLFVVGDPKQSIYAWRSADLAAYDDFVDEVEAAGGEKHPLTSNFRSVRPILDEVELLVKPVMHEEHGFQPAFEGLDATDDRIASPGFRQGRWSAVEHWNCRTADEIGDPKTKKQKVDELNAEEARTMAADIRSLHDEAGVAFGDVAVLLRATTAQHFILEAFREFDVPFEVARERKYYRQREIIEAAGLVRAILEPADALALLTVIRSDAVGVPDAALAPLWDAGLPAAAARLGEDDVATLDRVRRVVAEAAERVGAEPGVDRVPAWPQVLTAALKRLAELRRSMREDPPDVFVERLRTLWLAEVSAAARYLGRFRQARLDGFFAELEKTLSGGRGSAAEVARFLRRSVGEGREAPSAPEPDLDTDAVHVMTIYGAKGLDFGHVYLAQIHRESRGPVGQVPAVLRRVGGVAELKLFGWPTPGFEAAEIDRELQARAERVRLLYVAATRAKERLVVSGGWEEPGSEMPPLEAKTFADLIARRDADGVYRRLAKLGIGREMDSGSGVTWVMPALEDNRGSGGAGRRPSSGLASPDTVAADTAAIAAARADAAARMAVRWSRPASDAAHRNEGRRETDPGGDETASRPPRRNDFAAAVGTEIHRLLETFDFAEDLPKQIEARRTAIVAAVCGGLRAEEARSATARVVALLDRLVEGACLLRLAELTPFVVARELEVILAPDSDDGTSVISGAIDLVYRDPEDGRIVVADYKTDRVESESEIADRVERYRPQLEIYARALEQALGLDHRPHTELWFLEVDRIVRLS